MTYKIDVPFINSQRFLFHLLLILLTVDGNFYIKVWVYQTFDDLSQLWSKFVLYLLCTLYEKRVTFPIDRLRQARHLLHLCQHCDWKRWLCKEKKIDPWSSCRSCTSVCFTWEAGKFQSLDNWTFMYSMYVCHICTLFTEWIIL